ncbi:MAG: ECF-type sigma factor [Phycisphaerales bacterium]
MSKPTDVTLLLSALAEGDRTAADHLLPLLYSELRALAGAMFADERKAHTLQPTALVHEAFLRLVGGTNASQASPAALSRAHFLALAAKVMRQVLIDHARARNAAKRNHGQVVSNATIALDRTPSPDAAQPDILDLDGALVELTALYPRAANVVEMRAFGGLTDPEIATLLGVSRATVERDWTLARNWLKRRLDTPPREGTEGGGL